MEEAQGNLRTLLDLPDNIIEEILLQFPVKDLLRLKSVSKSLCSFISSESMVKAHLLKSSKDASFTHFKIVTGDVREPRYRYPSYWSRGESSAALDRAIRRLERRRQPSYLLFEELTNVYDFLSGSLERRRKREFTAVRYCNGLVYDFSRSGKDFTLRNPSTRKYKKLPPVGFVKCIYKSAPSCGFGYVESSNDYKVFALSLQRRVGGVYHCIAKVYSLKRDCWRIVDDDYKTATPMDLTARSIGGVLYWLRMFRKGSERMSWEIVSFDLEKEEFGTTVEQPIELNDSFYSPQLGVFNGSLCVLSINCIYKNTDMWVLLKQQTPPCWTKIPIFPDPKSSSAATHLAVSTDGVIFREQDAAFGLVYYLPNDMRMRCLRILELDIFDSVCAYVESLVSLGDSHQAGISGSVIDFVLDKGRLLDIYGDDDE